MLISFLFLLFSYVGFFESVEQPSIEQNCDRIKLSVLKEVNESGNTKVTVKAENAKEPIKYFFMDNKGSLLNESLEDLGLNSRVLEKGNYLCAVIDVEGCSSKIKFEIK